MNKEALQTGRIYQDFDFEVTDFASALLEGLVGMEDQVDQEPLLVFIKIKDKNWNRFFLDAGAGFWENWQETEIDQTEAHIDEVVYVDYAKQYQLENKQIESIVCKNAQITIAFKDKTQFVLKEINPGNSDSPSEILFIL